MKLAIQLKLCELNSISIKSILKEIPLLNTEISCNNFFENSTIFKCGRNTI